MRVQYYTANNLNQCTQRTVPGYVDVIGTATNSATVAVNHASTSRKADYYRREVSVPNSGPVWQSITNTALIVSSTNDIVTNVVGNVFVPKTPEIFGYDADGNQTNDGRWAMTWDGENRLVKMQSLSGAPNGSSNRLTFVYDQQGRRVSKTTEAFVSGAWSITLSNRFIYDGWNLLAEINATNNTVINSYVWGLDLSGSEQGAGGVGGLLVVNTTNSGSHFVGFDGNGNVSALVNATNGSVSARYEYDPFGRLLRATGPLASLNSFRFSTKFDDGESGLLYYGYRYYDSKGGNWVNRDPIEERGGINLSVTLSNDTQNHFDLLGLFCSQNLCGGKVYGPSECCIGNVIKKRKKMGTGVYRCNYAPPPPLPDWQGHQWIEWELSSRSGIDGSSGFNHWNNKRWENPDAEQGRRGGGAGCREIELSPCEHDLDLFKTLVRRKTSTDPGPKPSGYDCGSYVNEILSAAEKESEYK